MKKLLTYTILFLLCFSCEEKRDPLAQTPEGEKPTPQAASPAKETEPKQKVTPKEKTPEPLKPIEKDPVPIKPVEIPVNPSHTVEDLYGRWEIDIAASWEKSGKVRYHERLIQKNYAKDDPEKFNEKVARNKKRYYEKYQTAFLFVDPQKKKIYLKERERSSLDSDTYRSLSISPKGWEVQASTSHKFTIEYLGNDTLRYYYEAKSYYLYCKKVNK